MKVLSLSYYPVYTVMGPNCLYWSQCEDRGKFSYSTILLLTRIALRLFDCYLCDFRACVLILSKKPHVHHGLDSDRNIDS